MLVNTCSYKGVHDLCVCRSQKGRIAFQIKLALNTVHFHALQRCARINELELKQFDQR